MKIKPPDILSMISPIGTGGSVIRSSGIQRSDSVTIEMLGPAKHLLEQLLSTGCVEDVDPNRLEKMSRLLQQGKLDDYLPQAVDQMIQESGWLETWLNES